MTPNLVMFKHVFKVASAARTLTLLLGAALTGFIASPVTLTAQAPASNPNRFMGTIATVAAGSLTVKTDAGVERKVTVPDGIKLQRIAPGEKDLSKAATIQFSDLAVGDRVLVRLAPEPATDPVTAIGIIAIPQADLAQKQQKDREDWQRNGVGGLVKSVDPGSGVITITSGVGTSQKTTVLHTTPTTVLRRYAADSVNFDDAKPAPLEVIKPGDQLRARGEKKSDGSELAAAEVVSGSFRNIAGTISTINTATMTVTLKDLSTKQTVNVHVGPEAQMRKLSEATAKMLASSTKPAGDNHPDSSQRAATNAPGAGSAPSASSEGGQGSHARPSTGDRVPPDAKETAESGGSHPQSGDAQAGRHGGGDPQQLLARAPAIHLSDLQKGDAIMLVATQGATDVTAITLLAGVEPLLQAPASTQNMLLSNWNMSSGGAEGAQ